MGLNSIFMQIPPFLSLCKYGFWVNTLYFDDVLACASRKTILREHFKQHLCNAIFDIIGALQSSQPSPHTSLISKQTMISECSFQPC